MQSNGITLPKDITEKDAVKEIYHHFVDLKHVFIETFGFHGDYNDDIDAEEIEERIKDVKKKIEYYALDIPRDLYENLLDFYAKYFSNFVNDEKDFDVFETEECEDFFIAVSSVELERNPDYDPDELMALVHKRFVDYIAEVAHYELLSILDRYIPE